MSDWILEAVGDEVPLHFSAFHPDFRMLDRPRTPHETLIAARDVAMKAGLKYVYVGNVDDAARQSTFCPNCKKLLIERNWYEIGEYALDRGQMPSLRHAHRWCVCHTSRQLGRKRQPVDMRQFHSPDRDKPLVLPETTDARRGGDPETGRRGDFSEFISFVSWSPCLPVSSSHTAAFAVTKFATGNHHRANPQDRSGTLADTSGRSCSRPRAELVRAAAEGRAPETSAFVAVWHEIEHCVGDVRQSETSRPTPFNVVVIRTSDAAQSMSARGRESHRNERSALPKNLGQRTSASSIWMSWLRSRRSK